VTDLKAETVIELANRFPGRIIGIKDASGDLSRVSEHRMGIKGAFCQMSGDDDTAMPHFAAGGVGCISVTANVAPRLCAEFQAALAAGEMYRLCATLEGLTVIGAAESLPFVIQAYAEAPYSLARSRALTALRPHANHEIVSELLVESLWDCESETREIACATVPLADLTAVRRLRALGADVFEDAEVRRAAAGRGLRVSDNG